MTRRVCGYVLLIVLIFWAQISFAFKPNINSVKQAYLENSYEESVSLIRNELVKIKNQDSSSRIRSASYEKQITLLLAHINAWKLNEPNVAIDILENLIKNEIVIRKDQLIQSAIINLLIAEIYNQNKKFDTALENYNTAQTNFEKWLLSQNDPDARYFVAGVFDFINFNIDTILYQSNSKNFVPLYSKVNLFELSSPRSTFSFAVQSEYLAPGLFWEREKLAKTNKSVSKLIAETPPDRSAMILEYYLLMNPQSGEIDSSLEEAIKIYIEKYPDTYFAFSLRSYLYKKYIELGNETEALGQLETIRSFAIKRKINLKEAPEKRFANPEATWDYYRNALASGEVEKALECHRPGDTAYREMFRLLGPDELKEIGKEMGDISKVRMDKVRAKYKIYKLIEGNNITFDVNFININGEWKIESY